MARQKVPKRSLPTRSSWHGHAQECSCADCTPETAGAVETFFEEHGDEVVTVVLGTVARYETQPLGAGRRLGQSA